MCKFDLSLLGDTSGREEYARFLGSESAQKLRMMKLYALRRTIRAGYKEGASK